MKLEGSSFKAILATTRPDMGNAEIPQAPIMGFSFCLRKRFASFAKSTPPTVSKINAAAPRIRIFRTSRVRIFSAVIVAPTVIPRKSVTRLASSFCAVLARESTTPDTFSILPNMSAPMSGTEIGARIPAKSTTIKGKRKRAVHDTGFSSLYAMRIRLSCFVVSSLIIGGWIIGTRDI